MLRGVIVGINHDSLVRLGLVQSPNGLGLVLLAIDAIYMRVICPCKLDIVRTKAIKCSGATGTCCYNSESSYCPRIRVCLFAG